MWFLSILCLIVPLAVGVDSPQPEANVTGYQGIFGSTNYLCNAWQTCSIVFKGIGMDINDKMLLGTKRQPESGDPGVQCPYVLYNYDIRTLDITENYKSADEGAPITRTFLYMIPDTVEPANYYVLIQTRKSLIQVGHLGVWDMSQEVAIVPHGLSAVTIRSNAKVSHFGGLQMLSVLQSPSTKLLGSPTPTATTINPIQTTTTPRQGLDSEHSTSTSMTTSSRAEMSSSTTTTSVVSAKLIGDSLSIWGLDSMSFVTIGLIGASAGLLTSLLILSFYIVYRRCWPKHEEKKKLLAAEPLEDNSHDCEFAAERSMSRLIIHSTDPMSGLPWRRGDTVSDTARPILPGVFQRRSITEGSTRCNTAAMNSPSVQEIELRQAAERALQNSSHSNPFV